MTLEAEVGQIQASLKKAVADSNIEAILDMLKALSILLITRDVLSATKIGVDVNGIAKAFSTNKVVQAPAAALVKQWKEVAAQAKAERQSSRPKKEINYNEEKQEAAAGFSSSSSQAVFSSDDPALKMKMKTKISKKIGEGPLPKRNTHNEWCFSDYPDFKPNLSPKEVLQMGSFGGTYFRPIKSGCTGLVYGKEVWQELPEDWLKGLNISKQVANPVYSASLNRYKVKCGGDLDMWESSGWMRDSDPYGWFQWYCRFFQGRRCSDDDRQVQRGLSCMGEKGRWRSTLSGKIADSVRGTKTIESQCEDHAISPVVRQTLQHWGYRITPRDMVAYRKRTGR